MTERLIHQMSTTQPTFSRNSSKLAMDRVSNISAVHRLFSTWHDWRHFDNSSKRDSSHVVDVHQKSN